jgi:hypothetical protein
VALFGGTAALFGANEPVVDGVAGGPMSAGGRGGSNAAGGVWARACHDTASATAHATAASRQRARPASCPVAVMVRVYRRNLGNFKPLTAGTGAAKPTSPLICQARCLSALRRCASAGNGK